MRHARTITEWSILGLTALMLLSLGWSAHRPYYNLAVAASVTSTTATAHPEPALIASPSQQIEDDFINPQAFSAQRTEAQKESRPILPGESVRLAPITPLTVSATGRLEFIALVKNSQNADWRVVGELRVLKSDGTEDILLKPRAVTLRKFQTLRLPAGFAAKRFPAGPTEFIAILRNLSGQEIDRARVTFTIER